MELQGTAQPRLYEGHGPRSAASSSTHRSRRSRSSSGSETAYSHTTFRTEDDDISYKFEYLQGPDDLDQDCSASYLSMPGSPAQSPRASVASVASTVSSIHEDGAQDDRQAEEQEADFDMPDFQLNDYYTETVPTTPLDFGKLFPSTRRLSISHDDSVRDGNMNLKITTTVKTPRGRLQNMTLFHLRMYDLKRREFSVRRYDRDSGREVAHSIRKYQAPADSRRPSLQRSLSSALAGFRSRSDTKTSSLARVDSHHTSKRSLQVDDDSSLKAALCVDAARPHRKIPTNTTKLEFSNYAQVEIRRRGTHLHKRYEFEYWGTTYQWKRTVSSQDGHSTQTSFQLVKTGESVSLANIVPEPLSPAQQQEEADMGRWVPPCAMWVSDEGLSHMQNDVSDVVVSTGLIALVDDCIKSRFHNKSQPGRSTLFNRFPRLSFLQHASGQHQSRGMEKRPTTAAPTIAQQRTAPQLRHAVTT